MWYPPFSHSFEPIRHFVAGKWQDAGGSNPQSRYSPYTGTKICELHAAPAPLVDQAILAAAAAQKEWGRATFKERAQVLFRFREILLAEAESLGGVIAMESGKTPAEGIAGLMKGVEVLEFALALQNLEHGGSMQVSRGVTCDVARAPLGVVAGIVPFNFPAMVPMWMFPIALALGNAFVMKPSDKVPMTMQRLATALQKAGLPNGIFTVLNGNHETAQQIAAHPEVKSIGFVGSTPVALQVYRHATNLGKRCLALGGAKNPVIVTPDADVEITAQGVVQSFTGCAGQRCMAASLLLAVGPADHLLEAIQAHAKKIQLGEHMGAIIDKTAKERIVEMIKTGTQKGAKAILDGSSALPSDDRFRQGNWVGPTILDQASFDMDIVQQEIFGPVLTVLRVKTISEAVQVANRLPYGNAISVFTSQGPIAQYVRDNAEAGMLGINIGVPVPREPFSFGGIKASKFGQGDITGVASLDLWSDLRKVTTKWTMPTTQNWMS